MKDLGYGKDYRYAHDEDDGVAAGMDCLPEALKGARYYTPARDVGFETRLREKLEWIRKIRRKKT